MAVHERPRRQLKGNGGSRPLHRPLLGFTPERSSPKGRGGVAQGLLRRRVRRPSDDAAESGTVLVSSMMEPIALTKSSPDAAGAGRTAVGLRLLKPKRARAGKEQSRQPLAPLCLVLGSWSASGTLFPVGIGGDSCQFSGEHRPCRGGRGSWKETLAVL